MTGARNDRAGTTTGRARPGQCVGYDLGQVIWSDGPGGDGGPFLPHAASADDAGQRTSEPPYSPHAARNAASHRAASRATLAGAVPP